jgi:hypothetical protein
LYRKNTNNGVGWGFLWDLAPEYLASVTAGGEEHQQRRGKGRMHAHVKCYVLLVVESTNNGVGFQQ